MTTLGALAIAALLAMCGPAGERQAGAPLTPPTATTAPADVSRDGAIVAMSDLGAITYRKIRCGSRVPADQCRAIEQENLRVRLSQMIIDAAAATHGVEISEEEQREVDRQVAADHAGTVDAARMFRAAIAGAARVHAGEPIEHVAAALGTSVQMIEQAMNEYPTAAEANNTLKRDFIEEIEAAVRKTYTREKLQARLRALVHERAAARGITDDEEAAAFWKDVAAQHHFRVVDSRYQLPDFTGVLKFHEISTETSH